MAGPGAFPHLEFFTVAAVLLWFTILVVIIVYCIVKRRLQRKEATITRTLNSDSDSADTKRNDGYKYDSQDLEKVRMIEIDEGKRDMIRTWNRQSTSVKLLPSGEIIPL